MVERLPDFARLIQLFIADEWVSWVRSQEEELLLERLLRRGDVIVDLRILELRCLLGVVDS